MIQDTPDQSGRLVERLVGPADQELSCEECFDFLDAYKWSGHRAVGRSQDAEDARAPGGMFRLP